MKAEESGREERYARLDERPPLGVDTQRMLAEP